MDTAVIENDPESSEDEENMAAPENEADMPVDAEEDLLKQQKLKIFKKTKNELMLACRTSIENKLTGVNDENLNDYKEHVLRLKNEMMVKIEEICEVPENVTDEDGLQPESENNGNSGAETTRRVSVRRRALNQKN